MLNFMHVSSQLLHNEAPRREPLLKACQCGDDYWSLTVPINIMASGFRMGMGIGMRARHRCQLLGRSQRNTCMLSTRLRLGKLGDGDGPSLFSLESRLQTCVLTC